MHRSIDIGMVLDRPELGTFRRRVILLCWLIGVIDGFDVQAMAFVAPVLAPLWEIPRLLLGQILTAGVLGAMLGSMFLGLLGDRIGRRPVLIGSVVLFGVGSLLTSFTESTAQLMLARCFTGVGLGGAIVAALAMTTEYAPARSRATLIAGMFVGFPIGGILGGLIATPLMASYGWRAMFVLGGIMPLALISFIGRYLPESLRFKIASGAAPEQIGVLVRKIDSRYRYRTDDVFVLAEHGACSGRVAALFAHGRLAGTLLIWLIFLANLFANSLLINWLPSILHQSGLSLAMANVGTVMFNVGGVVGALSLGRAVDRVGACRVLAPAYALTAALVLVLARMHSNSLALALTTVAGGGITGAQSCIFALASAYYPTSIRSTGVGWALGVGRVGSIGGPLAAGSALGSGATVTSIYVGVALLIVICSVAVLLLSVACRRGAPLVSDMQKQSLAG